MQMEIFCDDEVAEEACSGKKYIIEKLIHERFKFTSSIAWVRSINNGQELEIITSIDRLIIDVKFNIQILDEV